MLLLLPAMVAGRYRVVISPELERFIEERFVSPAPIEQQEAVRREALAEAQAAELELHADGTVESRSGQQSFYRVPIDWPEAPEGAGSFDKPGAGRVLLRFDEAGRLVAEQAGKPQSVFVRDSSACRVDAPGHL